MTKSLIMEKRILILFSAIIHLFDSRHYVPTSSVKPFVKDAK
ncbi:predicted protein [Sclerotinia sclerotiorum 1980 UF-70]|uniref:Uncharacterized protein n=1 Tax=Sclerotinia sclerotiorum (strain ATCC 18683 / 1980 / Ss-1) TaxID=665079 RepID=A7ELZ3_SCLS1|nr:predicted protein [Sclerotinia sclerotiorum 1980 UF-70]EDO03859.1 predicted protein [Sclerotinia sclerotiorum 1980 UF-70]